MKKIRGAIFDLDGTVLDSMYIWEQIDIDFLTKRNIVKPDDYMKEIAPMGAQKAAEYTKARFGLPESIEEIKKEWDDMSENAYRTQIKTKPGVGELLSLMKAENIKMAVATASNEILYVPALKNNGIYDYFESFTTVNEVKYGKGFSHIYEKAAEKMGLKIEECAVFEDIYEGLKAAKAAGFFTIGVFEPLSAYGEDKIREESDIYIKDFYELIKDGKLII